MQSEITDLAFEVPAVSVSSADVSTTVAGLGSVVAINQNHFLACEGSLVSNFVEEVCWTPTSEKAGNFPAFASAFPHLHSGGLEFLQCDCVAVASNYSFTNTVVHISDKPSFSSGQLLEMSFGGTSACSLKLLFIEPVFSFGFTNSFSVKKHIIGSNCGKVSSSINSNNCGNRTFCWNIDFRDYVQVDYSAFCAESGGSQFCSGNQILLHKVFWNGNLVFASSPDCANADGFGLKEYFEGIVCEPDSATVSFYWFRGFGIFEDAFQHITCLVSDRRNNAAVECGKLLAGGVIGKVMKPCFVVVPIFKADADTVVARLICNTDSVEQELVGICDSDLTCDLHNGLLERNIFKYLSLKGWYANPKDTSCNVQLELSHCVLPEIQEARFSRGSCKGSGGTDETCLHGEGLATPLAFNSARPRPYFYNCETVFFPDVSRESVEGGECYSCDESVEVCETVLESKLLRWNGWNCERRNNQEIHCRTGNPRFPTASIECSVPARR